ncbi:hypothetical protein [Thiolinea disciformis]|uniref:hypothetical protein n=1 Tax=Thiolinea disciformis TaxID=125614 RepID=UPI00036D3509|nr:hypothetical protein [Thiolinea disciformis]
MKNVNFQLALSEARFPSTLPTFDSELDSIVSLVHYLCAYISEQEQCRFRISGFGDNDWPVDIRTDLATLVPQLPQALLGIERSEVFNLDLFEQGVERYINFKPSVEGQWVIKCNSLTAWIPHPETQTLSTTELKSMLESFFSVFLDYLRKIPNQSGWEAIIDHWIKTGEESLSDS